MKTYNHAFSLGFSVAGSTDPEGEDITSAQFAAAVCRRIAELVEEEEWGEAVGAPFDSYEEDEE